MSDKGERPEPPNSRSGKITRRALLAGGGAAVAGLSLAGVTEAVAAPAAGRRGLVGTASEDQDALELVIKIEQDGDRFVTYGYLTRVAGLADASLFGGEGARDETSAHFTFHSVTHMTGRSINEPIHALQVSGPLDIYFRKVPGADFGDPNSFKQGTRIAAYEGDFQSIVNVTAPTKGIESLTGSLRQTAAHRFSLGGKSHVLGAVGLRGRVTATGDGTLLEPTLPKAVLLLAGSIVVIGSS
jgi:hypothetical protein